MRVVLCVKGMNRIFEVLTQWLPDDEVVECSPEEVPAAALNADVLVPTIAPIPAAAFSGARIKLVQQYGVGLDSIDLPAATNAGVLVANVPSGGTGNAESVAEFAIAHMLMLSRRIPEAIDRFRSGRVGGPMGACLWESTVVIYGYGGVGEAIARRLAGWGTRVIAVSRHGPDGTRARDPSVPLAGHVRAGDVAGVLGDADFLIVAAPASQHNIGIVNHAMLGALKRGAFVVNIARGPVIDYDALLGALRDGQVAGAGLDVFWQEPFDPDDPLLRENVLPTPHVAGVTGRSLLGIGQAVAANVNRIRRGELPECCANPDAWPGRLAALGD